MFNFWRIANLETTLKHLNGDWTFFFCPKKVVLAVFRAFALLLTSVSHVGIFCGVHPQS